MSTQKQPDIAADKLALYDKLIATHPGIRLGENAMKTRKAG